MNRTKRTAHQNTEGDLLLQLIQEIGEEMVPGSGKVLRERFEREMLPLLTNSHLKEELSVEESERQLAEMRPEIPKFVEYLKQGGI
ncbi:MAG: hypothetical protein EXS31_07875 [Pedosphaera sp.]|nr:hypothetical protein [Pedosphaera sp.]